MRKKNMLVELKKKGDELTRQEVKEAIIELNYYLLSAIEQHDKVSIQEIRKDMTDLVGLYLSINKWNDDDRKEIV
jgi:parvulin-like peptidyl-prolyl isomerase